MLFRNIHVLDDTFTVRKNCFVGIRGDRIAYLADRMPEEDYGENYNGRGKFLLPAFYNLHTHLPMALLRGYGEGLPLMDWLNTRIFPFEAELTDEDMYYGCLLGIAELLRFGSGCVSEMYLSHLPLCRAVFESGIKANVSRCVSCFDPETSYFDLPHYGDLLRAAEAYDGADGGRLRVEYSPHSEYTTTEKVVRELAETAKSKAASIHVHVSETAQEVADCRRRHGGRSPVRYLADCGVFDVPAVAAHCVWVDDEDLSILREKNVTVATCPKSNLKLASGIAPVGRMLNAGVNVGIGTDSVASNNNLNMLEELRFFTLLQKGVSGDPTLISPKQALCAATRAGAAAQRRDDCGLVRVGYKADLTVFDLNRIYLEPEHDLLTNFVHSAQGTDVCLTMVDGKVLYRDGEYPTLDLERIRFECEKVRKRILGSLAAKEGN